MRRPATRWASVLGFAASLGLGAPAPGQDASCEPPKGGEPPAAGHWTGTFALTYELQVPSMPPTMRFGATWQGTLDFDLVRPPDREDPPAPPPPPPLPRRSPLRPPSAHMPSAPAPTPASNDRANPGQFASDDAQRAALIADWQKRWREADRTAARYGQILLHGDQTGRLVGTARGTLQMQGGGVFAPGLDANTSGAGTARDYRLEAEEDDPTTGLQEIRVLGRRGEDSFAAAYSVVGREGGGAGSARIQGSGGGEEQLSALTLEETRCWLMRGTVDASLIRSMMRQSGAGMDIRVTGAEWEATLEERDEAFEQRVRQLASQPVPAEMSWEVADRFAQQFQQLHSEAGKDPYKRCVLMDAQRQGLRLTVAALRTLLRHAPRVEDGATAPVLDAWFQRALGLTRSLALSGMEDCSLVEQVQQKLVNDQALLVAAR